MSANCVAFAYRPVSQVINNLSVNYYHNGYRIFLPQWCWFTHMHYLYGENLVLIIILILESQGLYYLHVNWVIINLTLECLLLFAFKLSCFGIIPWLKTTKVVTSMFCYMIILFFLQNFLICSDRYQMKTAVMCT